MQTCDPLSQLEPQTLQILIILSHMLILHTQSSRGARCWVNYLCSAVQKISGTTYNLLPLSKALLSSVSLTGVKEINGFFQ